MSDTAPGNAALRVQVVRVGGEGAPQVLVGDADCNADPCAKHGTCHCMCVCMPDGDDNCPTCAEAFDA